MENKYKITEEEINQTILHSPYSLADSPSAVGLKAKQIKKYFYEFIRFFANKINVHLSDLGETLRNYDELCQAFELIPELQEKDAELGRVMLEILVAHNQSEASHPYLNEKISKDIGIHNASALSHADIRKTIKAILDKLDVAYSLASGKSRVFSCEDVIDVLETVDANEIHKGDLLLVADSQKPDFTVFETGLTFLPDSSIELDYNSVAEGEIDFEIGKSYYYKGIRMIASIGTLETGLLAKNDDLIELENAFWEHWEEAGSKISEIESILKTKEKAIERVEMASPDVTLQSGKEYDLGLITALKISAPENVDGLEAIVNLRSGSSIPTIEARDIVFSGDDTLGGRFYPTTHRIYEINIKEVLGTLVAKVGASDYEVIE